MSSAETSNSGTVGNPRLTIIQLLGWTAVTAVLLAIRRSFGNQSPFHGYVVAFVVLQGPALFTLFAWPFWHWKGYRFPVHGGAWLLVTLGAVAALSALVLPFEYVMGRIFPMGHRTYGVFRIPMAIYITGVAACYLIASIRVRQAAWCIAFALLALAYAIFSVEVVQEVLMPSRSIGSLPWKATITIFSFGGVFLAMPVLFVACADVVRRRALPWTHWLGVGLFLCAHAIDFGRHVIGSKW